MKDKKIYSYPTDHMLTVGLGFSIFYWLCEFFISMLSTHHGNTLVQLFGKSIDDVWTRIVVLCLFMIFGSHAQYTIDKRKKAEESLRRQNEYMEALHETALGLIRRLELNDLLQAIINRATSLTRIPNGFIYLYNAEQNELEMKVGTGIFAAHTGLRLKPGEGLAGKVWLKKESTIINNYQSLPEKIGHFDSIRCIMAIPLKSERGADGVMGLCHTEKGKFIDSESAEMSERFSKLASVALYNARLYTDMQHELERRKQAEKESREMENQLRRSQKMEALGTLAGGIAHDFNNILSAIIGFAEMAMMYDTSEGSKTHTHIRQVVNAGLRARELVRQILTFSRESRQDKQIIAISSSLKEVLHLLRASLSANIDIRREIAEDAGCILADPTEIHQIIMNLCTNAAHAMEDKGGMMTVSLANVFADHQTYPGLSGDGDYVSLKVKDTGCGISPDIIEKIFNPYFTTKAPGKGTGLGLAIVNRIIQSHNGTIRIQSRIGEGTEIVVLFPLVKREVEIRTAGLSSPATGSGRILFVDDEELLEELGKDMLEKLGYTVSSFTDPFKAIEHFKAQPEIFDAIISDINMPELTGIQLSREMLNIRADIPIILTTGFSEDITPEELSAMGVFDMLMKPLTIHDLAGAVQKAIHNRGIRIGGLPGQTHLDF